MIALLFFQPIIGHSGLSSTSITGVAPIINCHGGVCLKISERNSLGSAGGIPPHTPLPPPDK